MAKKYKGSLSLEWYNKQKSILLRSEEDIKMDSDIPAPKINWINKDEALFYEIDEEEGKGLTPYWVDRNDIRVKEARPLIHQKTFKAFEVERLGTLLGTEKKWKVMESDEDDQEVENILIKGVNLLALNTLRKLFDNIPDEDKAQCIYIDPPYNIGKAFEFYDDNLEHSEWLTLIRDRLTHLKELLREGGFIMVQLDDSEGPYGKVILDEVFGRDNFIITMYVQVRYDTKTLKEDMVFNKLIEQIHIYRKNNNVKSNINRDKIEYTNEKFCVRIDELKPPFKILQLGGKEVQVFDSSSYSIKTEQPSKQGLKEIWASGSILDGNSSGRFFRDFLTDRKHEDGLGVLYKVSNIGDDGLGYRYFTGPKNESATRGKYYQGIPTDKQDDIRSYKFVPISNFIDLAASFGNCRHEGGVEFKSGKKPEILLSKLFEISTNSGDLIIDCFGGSGTSFAVAHKMKRRWIGVEIGVQAETHIVPRLKGVIQGSDLTGISREVNWSGGGGFKFYRLGSSILNVLEDGSGDFNWKLGVPYLEESFLSSYDYILETTIRLGDKQLFPDDNTAPRIGIQRVGTKTRVGIISLNPPDGDRRLMSYDEIFHIYRTVKETCNPEFINIFTNRGVEIAYDSKPADLEIIKIPEAIFAELEK